MESRNQNQQQQHLISSCPSPLPSKSSSSSSVLFADISNFKTPKNPIKKKPNFASTPYHGSSTQSKYFTASKATPVSSSSVQRPLNSSASRSKASRRLKAFELEQAKSARKAQLEKEKSLKSLAKSLTVWLNFLFENPKSCGCDVSAFTGEFDRVGHGGGMEEHEGAVKGKRGSGPQCGGRIGVEGPWRGPKRQRNLSWKGGSGKGENAFGVKDPSYLGLKASLDLVCSFDDLKERMRNYLSSESCKEIFDIMTQVTKNIDDGRLKMRAHCPMVTDVAMRERSLKILMSYNLTWLRTGLYIILGGNSLLPQGVDMNSEQEIAFLRLVLEKQFFAHPELAKGYAYNKLVDGLYRPGYYEKLGTVILKRFLLLVLVLDRAKSHSSLPLKYGIDGLDGGSPLLFSVLSNIKSSNQLITEFLSSDVMHGEGNLLAHLVIVGYKVTYQQSPLVEYNFRVADLFQDLQDGVRLCRAIQLLHHDSSILLKMVIPSDTRKKSLVNCGIALQHLKQAGVSLCDDDGMLITAEDVVNREKELTLSLLWNMFVHMQLPLLVSKTLLSEEICKIRGVLVEESSSCTLLDMLLGWIQAIAESYNLKIENFSCLVDGKAMWCLLDYYFRKEHHCSSFKNPEETSEAVSLVSTNEYCDAVHNFILSQKLTSLLGNFPEVLQVSDILEHKGACNDQSVVILLVFLSFQLLVKRNKDQLNFHKLLGFICRAPERKSSDVEDELQHASEDTSKKFKAIMSWWQDMAEQNKHCTLLTSNQDQVSLTRRRCSSVQRENAAKIIQSHFRRLLETRRFKTMKRATSKLQIAVRAWLTLKRQLSVNVLVAITQQAVRAWLFQRYGNHCKKYKDLANTDLVNAIVVACKWHWGWKAGSGRENGVDVMEKASTVSSPKKERFCDQHTMAALTIQSAWKKFLVYTDIQKQRLAATRIQSHVRCMLVVKSFRGQKEAVLKIQSIYRSLKSWREFQSKRQERISIILIQSHARGWITRKSFHKLRSHTMTIQRHIRGWLRWKKLLCQEEAIHRIQNAFRSLRQRRLFCCQRLAALDIQRFIRGYISRKRLLGTSCWHEMHNSNVENFELKIVTLSVIKLQRWWRSTLAVKERRKSAIIIQSYFRRSLKRKELLHQKEAAVRIQTAFRCMKQQSISSCRRLAAVEIQRFVRGYITRKRLVGASGCHKLINGNIGNYELKLVLLSVLKLQRWWRNTFIVQQRTRSAIVIQSYFRGWRARQIAARDRHRISVVQAYWKGYLVRKDTRGQLLDLRLRVQQSAANVDDSMRLINRLIAALSELLSKRSVRSILHTCATLDLATKHSQRCCEELVQAGAISTLLKQILSVSQSIPDQAVLKYALSTLRNLSRYPHLREVLIDTTKCAETILWQIIRNKDEVYFIACELLKNICLHKKGIEVIRKSSALLKRLQALVEDLSKKEANEKRKKRTTVAKEQSERRLRAAVELLELIKGT